MSLAVLGPRRRSWSSRLALSLIVLPGLILGGAASAAAATASPARGAGLLPWPPPHESVVLSASPTTLPVGAATTLTATTNVDVGPTPYYIDIYDATTGQQLAACGDGTSCAVTVSQSAATTQEYIAYIAFASATNPPAGIQATSLPAFVTWSDLGWSVSLSAPGVAFSGSATVTATANRSGPAEYIEIYELSPLSDNLVASCVNTETCSTVVNVGFGGSESLVAFAVRPYLVPIGSHWFPPFLTLASSNVATVRGLLGF